MVRRIVGKSFGAAASYRHVGEAGQQPQSTFDLGVSIQSLGRNG